MKNKFKFLIFSILPLLILFLSAEVILRWIYFSKKEKRPLASVYNFELWKNKAKHLQERRQKEAEILRLKEANEKIALLVGGSRELSRNSREKCVQELYSAKGKELLGKFRESYEKDFEEFSKEVKESGGTLYVTYFPSGRPQNERDACREFYRSISEKRGISFFDMTPILKKYPEDFYMLLPDNGHLSRFGNQLIAEEFKRIILSKKFPLNAKFYQNRPALLGDLSPNSDQIVEPQAGLVYRETVNSQGLRLDRDVLFPKQKPRILCVGDSFTYGPYFHAFFTYPGLLQRYLPGMEVINGGIPGYHIGDELAYYKERGKFLEADIVILQVLDNDIAGRFFFYQNLFSRSKGKFLPSPEEIVFFEKVKEGIK